MIVGQKDQKSLILIHSFLLQIIHEFCLPLYKRNHTIMLSKLISKFAFGNLKVPVTDVSRYLTQGSGWEKDCHQIANTLRKYGLVIIKDPRVNQQENDRFLDLMQRYFVKRSQQYHEGNKTIDFSPESNYQVGIMHEYQQKFQSYEQEKRRLIPPNHSLTPVEASRDPKWRYHWKVDYPHNVIPKDFPEFKETMDSWGQHMKNGCLTVAQMTAVGLGLERNFLSNTIVNGAFMLSPTAVDLQTTKVGDVLAAFHRDFDLLTIHGKARYSGLFAWLNTGEKFMVRVPEGHLLLQAGKQLQWFTGGEIRAGFHEVVHTEEVEQAKQKALKEGRIPWRISSTMFCQVEDAIVMKPHEKFASEEAKKIYGPIRADQYLNQELHYLTGVK